jgi:imidazolonepropionase-like amidohydrolase
MKYFNSIFILTCLFFISAQAENNSRILIQNATVITATEQGTLLKTDVLIEQGIITKVGQNIETTNAFIIDASNKIITPGLIAPHSTLGLIELDSESETRDDSTDHYSAGFSIVDAFNPSSVLIPYNRAGGITSAIVVPSSGAGIYSGMASVFKTDGLLKIEPVAKDVAIIMEFGGSKDSRAAHMLMLKDSFDLARRFTTSKSSILRGGYFDFGDYNVRDLVAIQRLLKGEIPLIIRANRASDLLKMINFSKEHRIDIIFLGAKEAWRIADTLATDSIGARLDNAAILHRAGVKILITSQNTHNSYLSRQGAGNAVAHGLSKDEAIKALTINIAETFGLQDEIGSIEVGKHADIVLWDNDPLEVSSFADAVFIDGNSISLMTRSKRLRDRYLNKLGLN